MPSKKSKHTDAHVLITGGGGYIGSVLTPALLARGYRVTVLDNFMHRQTGLAGLCHLDGFEVVRGDCRDRSVLTGLLRQADIIIPLAAIVGAPACQRDQVAATTTNLDAIRLLCRLSSRSQRILFPVTNSGYGIGEKDKACTEASPLRPVSLYGVTKVKAEAAILDRGNAITLRLATVFGASPRMRLDLLVNDFVWRAVTDRAVVLFEAHFKRNYIHIRDVAEVFLHSMKDFGRMKDKSYNVGLEDANLSKAELCRRIKDKVPGFVYLEAAVGEDPDKRDYMVSNARMLATGFRPRFSLDDGIDELIKCYRIISRSEHSNV
ncbi:MAG: SDR family oxidoreductase [Elusimicrobiota bacterium]